MDFLKRFVCDSGVRDGGYRRSLKQEPVDEENVELSLGLSLNGLFGIERRRLVTNNNNRLIRASSVVSFQSVTEDETALTRTCSLPIAGEEWKRKELQSLRRLEAKRKRVEKIKNGNCEMKRRKLIDGNELLPPSVQSVGSPASGGSSGVSDLESQPFSGLNKDIESKSTGTPQSALHQISSSTPSTSNSIASEKTSAQNISNENHLKDETLKMILADMPCVSTKGNGVNGKKIQGFLYRYRKGKEVRIVCVCHGSFLTPAEFVKHGGGGDVEHPLRHIVVNPPSL